MPTSDDVRKREEWIDLPRARRAYAERNKLVSALVRISGWPAWEGCDSEWPGYRVVYLETPKGQLSWHVPSAEMEQFGDLTNGGTWDGHGIHEKYARLAALTRRDIG